jgi:hypothetical protein
MKSQLKGNHVMGLIAALGITVMICGLVSEARGDSAADPELQIAATFADNFLNDRYDALVPYLDATMKSVLTQHLLTTTDAALKGQYGEIVSKSFPTVTKKIQIYTAVYVPYQFQKAALTAKVVFDADGKIAGFFLVPPGTD